MSAPHDNPPDLSELIAGASDQIAVAEARRRTRFERDGLVRRIMPALSLVILLGAALWSADLLWRHIAPHTEEKTVRDLTAIVEQVRRAVESVRNAQGSLPEVIPNASLAAVVFYDYAGDSYRLIAESGAVRVTLNPDGTPTIDKGPAK
ncbi:MAG: hypothetical protein ACO3F9_00910 [Burkholderiales bacterium]